MSSWIPTWSTDSGSRVIDKTHPVGAVDEADTEVVPYRAEADRTGPCQSERKVSRVLVAQL